jgi:hypothetical protein
VAVMRRPKANSRLARAFDDRRNCANFAAS